MGAKIFRTTTVREKKFKSRRVWICLDGKIHATIIQEKRPHETTAGALVARCNGVMCNQRGLKKLHMTEVHATQLTEAFTEDVVNGGAQVTSVKFNP